MNDKKQNQINKQFIELPVKDIIPSKNNPRIINEKALSFVELLESIKAQGVIVPIHVRVYPTKKGKYELIAGERRLLASIILVGGTDSVKAKKATIPAINHGKISDEAAFEITFIENFCREDLTPLEQGKAVVTLMEKYKGDTEAVASKMGKSAKWVRQRQALGTKLSKTWRTALVEEDRESNIKHWTAGHLQLIASLPDSLQEEMLEYYHWDELPTIKQLDGHIAEMLQLLSKALFNTDEAGCSKCQKRTSCQPGLFDDDLDEQALKKNDRCLDRDCWTKKTAGWLKATYDVKKKELTNLLPITTEYIDQGIKADRQEVFGQVLEHHYFKQVSKKGKGAIPGFIVHGKALGTVLWVKPTSSAAESRAKKSTGKPTPLKQRRFLLEAKRWSRALIVLREKVEGTDVSKLNYKDKVTGLMALVAVYGNTSLWSSNTKTCQTEVASLCQHMLDHPTDAYSEALITLWNSFKPTLDDLLTYNGPITQTPKRFIDDAKWIAKLISVDINEIFKEVSEQKGFTIPKSWANLKPDGTPKTVKPKKKSTKKKQQKAKGKKNAKS